MRIECHLGPGWLPLALMFFIVHKKFPIFLMHIVHFLPGEIINLKYDLGDEEFVKRLIPNRICILPNLQLKIGSEI